MWWDICGRSCNGGGKRKKWSSWGSWSSCSSSCQVCFLASVALCSSAFLCNLDNGQNPKEQHFFLSRPSLKLNGCSIIFNGISCYVGANFELLLLCYIFAIFYASFDIRTIDTIIVINHPGRRTPAEESLCWRPRWMFRNANRYKYLRHIKESFEQKIKSLNLVNCFQMSHEEDGRWWQCQHVSFLKLFNVFIISVSFPKMFEWACKFLKLVNVFIKKFSLTVWCYKHQREQVSFLVLCCVH